MSYRRNYQLTNSAEYMLFSLFQPEMVVMLLNKLIFELHTCQTLCSRLVQNRQSKVQARRDGEAMCLQGDQF